MVDVLTKVLMFSFICIVLISMGIHIFIRRGRSLGRQIRREKGDRLGRGLVVYRHSPHPMGCESLHNRPLVCSCLLWPRRRRGSPFHEHPLVKVISLTQTEFSYKINLHAYCCLSVLFIWNWSTNIWGPQFYKRRCHVILDGFSVQYLCLWISLYPHVQSLDLNWIAKIVRFVNQNQLSINWIANQNIV